MRENYRNSIASVKKFPQFTTMNVIYGQAGIIIYASLIFYSLTIDNILNIIVLLILAAISISMLSGDNSILNRATQAKNETGTKQIQEKIRLAVAGAIANGNGSITEDLLKAELNKQFGENGYTLTDNDDEWEVEVNGVTETISKSGSTTGGGAGGNNNLSLTANVRETESRAAVIEVSLAVGTPPTEAELKAKSQDELKPIFVAAIQQLGAPFESWNDIPNVTATTTIEDVFTQFDLSSQYKDAYDLIIKEEGYKVATFTLNGEAITGATAEFFVTKNSSSDTSYTISATQGDNSGSVTPNVTKCKVEQYTKTAVTADSGKNSKTVTAKDNQTVEVPVGFYYGDDENVGKVSTGFVITDSVDEKGYSNGNEFVWIPITYTAASGSNAESIVVKNTSKPIATKTSGETENLPNYQGALYSEFLVNSNPDSDYVQSNTNNYREPAILSYDTGDYSPQGVTESIMQGDYNKMIQSVKTYGGFYVGRYEMGKGSNYSKIGVEPTSAEVVDENMWYGLYKKAREYNKSSITAGMIWGSQYDAMLNFALSNGNDGSKIASRTNGNHSGKKLKTGTWLGESSKTDKINNIFDLEGNMWEWTKEAGDTSSRIFRGGSFNAYTDDMPSFRGKFAPNDTYDLRGSRLGLYINV